MSPKWRNVAIGGGIAVAAAGIGYGLSELGVFGASDSQAIAGVVAGTAGSAFSSDDTAALQAIAQPSPVAAAPKSNPGKIAPSYLDDVLLGVRVVTGQT
jgi:hypothetical protein